MNRLPNRVTTDKELDRWCKKHVAGFKGVISRTDFPKLYDNMQPGDSAILNMDPDYRKGGTHWVAVKLSGDGPVIYYKDSFGAPPPTDVLKVGLASGRGILYGNNINQRVSEDNCGKRAAEFLATMSAAATARREPECFERLELSRPQK